MAQGDGPVMTDTLGNFMATLMTVSAVQDTFDGNNVITSKAG
jgi:hypothetical protein